MLILIIANQFLVAQNASSSCEQAIAIPVADNGFGLGTFISEVVDLTNAEKEFGEFFPEGFNYLALDHKTVWFKFKIETARGVRVELRQRDSAISQNAVGMAIYSGWNCIPTISRLEPRLIPINKFGEVSTNCLSKGEYLIQVCASHKANDTIWIEITTEKPPLLFDFQESAHDFGKFSGEKNVTVETSCLSLENSDELHKDLPSDYTKTAWFTFETNKNHLMFVLSIKPINPRTAPVDAYYAVLFKGDVRNGAIEDVSDTIHFWFTDYKANTNKLLEIKNCMLEDDTRYSILVYFNDNTHNSYSVDVFQKSNLAEKSAYPPTLGSEFDMGLIEMNQTKIVEGRFGCESFIKNNICEPVNSQTPFVWKNTTCELTAWRTFTINQEGEVRFNLGMGTSCNPLSFSSFELFYVVYRGDIRTNCNLPVIDTSFHNSFKCLTPGTYSVQILGSETRHDLGYSNITLCYFSNFGELFKLTISLNNGLTPIPSKYSNPIEPNKIGDLSSIFDSNPSYTVDLDYFGEKHPNDTLKFRFNYLNSRIYREFYLSKQEALRFTKLNYGNSQYLNSGFRIVKGRLSLGMDSSTILNNTILSFEEFSSNRIIGTQCEKVDTGWYSIVALAEYEERCMGEIPRHKYSLFSINRIASECSNIPNQTPSSAVSFNNTNNAMLSFASVPNQGTEADFVKEYRGGNSCLICDSTGKDFANQIYNSCKGSSDTLNMHTATYFYFILDQKSDVYLWNNEKLILYKGDYRNDSLGLLNLNNQIHACSDSIINFTNYYCGLEPGFYTVVSLVTQSGIKNNIFCWVDNHIAPKHDNAATAYQFPEMSPGLSFESPLGNISCLTGAHKEHPLVQNIPQKLLSYPMEQHIAQHDVFHTRNVWYTFTARGSGEVEVLFSNLSRRKQEIQNYIRVFESTSNPYIPYQTAYQNGLIDSSIAQGLIPIPLLDYSSSLRNRFFVKGSSCEDDTALKRYFVLIPYTPTDGGTGGGPILKQYFRVKVTMKPILEPKPPGDYCTSPVNFTTNNYGSFQSSNITVNCHTAGEGFGEDGSNMACLSSGTPVQTTWVKISVQNILKADLTFSIDPNMIVTSDNQKLRFRLLYGDCKALTPGPCLAFSGSSFRLDCMPPGDYYLQVSTPLGSKGTFKVNISVTQSQFPECKPASLFEPFANFNFTPPCNDSIVHFQNWSTAGEDISYFWDFGNGEFSSEKNPIVKFTSTKNIDTFDVRLYVTHNVYGSIDSITKKLRIRNTPPDLKINVLSDSFCQGFLELEAVSNESGNPAVLWSPTPSQLFQNGSVARYIIPSWMQSIKIVAQSQNDECFYSDSIEFNRDFISHLIPDTVICKNDSVAFDLNEFITINEIESLLWFDGSELTQKTFSDTGKFWVKYFKGACSTTDSFTISNPDLSDKVTPKTTHICEREITVLGINPAASNPIWSTGDTTHQIVVGDSGVYTVEAQMSSCAFYDTFSVFVNVISNPLNFSDSFKCIYDSLIVNPANNDYKIIWSDGSEGNIFVAREPGTYFFQASDSICDTAFVFRVSDYPISITKFKDSTHCELQSIVLDAGTGRNFWWEPGRETTQSILVNSFGTYSFIKENEYGCIEEDTFNYLRYCGPKLFIPNAFSPNGDGLNDEFLPFNENLVSFNMQIYNRWGEMIYNSSNSNMGWNGLFQGKLCQQGVYMYVISYTLEEEGRMIEGVTKGTLNLLR